MGFPAPRSLLLTWHSAQDLLNADLVPWSRPASTAQRENGGAGSRVKVSQKEHPASGALFQMLTKQCGPPRHCLRSLRTHTKAQPSNSPCGILGSVGCCRDGDKANTARFSDRFCNLEKMLDQRRCGGILFN